MTSYTIKAPRPHRRVRIPPRRPGTRRARAGPGPPRGAIILSGSETTYGPGSAVLNCNPSQWDPDGEWRHSMRAEEPTEEDCRAEAEPLMDTYVSEHSDENWSDR